MFTIRLILAILALLSLPFIIEITKVKVAVVKYYAQECIDTFFIALKEVIYWFTHINEGLPRTKCYYLGGIRGP